MSRAITCRDHHKKFLRLIATANVNTTVTNH